MTEVTYGQLNKVLRGLGFTAQVVVLDTKTRLYEHQATGAVVALPVFPDREKVFAHHLVAVRGTLDQFGIASPLDFAAQLQKAS